MIKHSNVDEQLWHVMQTIRQWQSPLVRTGFQLYQGCCIPKHANHFTLCNEPWQTGKLAGCIVFETQPSASQALVEVVQAVLHITYRAQCIHRACLGATKCATMAALSSTIHHRVFVSTIIPSHGYRQNLEQQSCSPWRHDACAWRQGSCLLVCQMLSSPQEALVSCQCCLWWVGPCHTYQ